MIVLALALDTVIDWSLPNSDLGESAGLSTQGRARLARTKITDTMIPTR